MQWYGLRHTGTRHVTSSLHVTRRGSITGPRVRALQELSGPAVSAKERTTSRVRSSWLPGQFCWNSGCLEEEMTQSVGFGAVVNPGVTKKNLAL